MHVIYIVSSLEVDGYYGSWNVKGMIISGEIREGRPLLQTHLLLWGSLAFCKRTLGLKRGFCREDIGINVTVLNYFNIKVSL